MKRTSIVASALAILLTAALGPAMAWAEQPAEIPFALTTHEDTGGGNPGGTMPGVGDPDDPEPQPVDIANATVSLPRTSWPCTGRAIKPSPTVKLGDATLVKNRDYTVSYQNNKAVGTANVVVTGTGAYSGTATARFAITPGNTTITSKKSADPGAITMTAKKTHGTTGYQFKIATNKAFTKNAKAKTTTKRTWTFKNLKKGKRYYLKARTYSIVGGKKVWGAWSPIKTVTTLKDGVWKVSKGYVYYRTPQKKLARGFIMIKGKWYLFDDEGRQKTGWQWYDGAYYFLNPGNKAKGYMLSDCVVNGIKLKKNGAAIRSGAADSELYVMWRAQAWVESLTKPTWSKRDKLEAGFNWMRDECAENNPREFSAWDGWHRTFALDILDNYTGSCFSCGAAFAYYANAVGCKSCIIISSGGHGWAEVDGDVYDVEWSRHSPLNYFAYPYSQSGMNGSPGYASARIYLVQIAPNTWRW